MKSESIDELKRAIRRSRREAFIVIAIFVLGYGYWFYWEHDYKLSLDTAAWGEFGDFIGGLLNPAIAYLVFWWFTKSILIQKEELENTRLAFEEQVNLQKRENVRAQLAELIQKEKKQLDQYLLSPFDPFQIKIDELGTVSSGSFSHLRTLFSGDPTKRDILASKLHEQMRVFYDGNENLSKYNRRLQDINSSISDLFEYIIIYSDVNDVHRLNINELSYLTGVIYKSFEAGALSVETTAKYNSVITEKINTSKSRHEEFLEFLSKR